MSNQNQSNIQNRDVPRTEQSETAQTNETTQEKVEGGLEGLKNGLSGVGFGILRLGLFLGILYLPTASVIERLPMPQLTDLQIVFVGSLIVGLLVLYLPTAIAVSKIYSPKKEFVAEIDGASESVLNIWYASPEKVDQMEVLDGKVRSKSIASQTVHLVNSFNPHENSCKAPREMEVTDWEMWGEKKAIERQRHRNNAFIEFGKQLFIRLPSLGQTLESKYWKQMSEKQTKKELTEPESFLNAIEEELPDLDPEVTEEMRTAHDMAESSTGGDNDE